MEVRLGFILVALFSTRVVVGDGSWDLVWNLFLSFELLPQGLRQDCLPALAPLGPHWRPGCDSCLLDSSTQCNPCLWSCYPVHSGSFTDTEQVPSRDEIPDDLHDLLTKLTLL